MSIEELFEEADTINIHTENLCLNCGSSLPNDYTTKCEICGYDSGLEFTCPYKVYRKINLPNQKTELGFCELTKKQCKVESLDFEICATFRSLDFLKEN